jgi:hypothetical protein
MKRAVIERDLAAVCETWILPHGAGKLGWKT